MMQLYSQIKFSILFLLFISYAYAAAKNNKLNSSFLGQQSFDFRYSGDIQGVPNALRQYDNNLKVLPSLGQKKIIQINLDLQATNLAEIADSIGSSSDKQVSLIYNEEQDSLRLSFSSTIDVGKDAVLESLKWQKGGAPKPVLKADGVVRFPYGEYQPIITCQPLNLCDIELQGGEDIQGIVIGDSQRWNEGDQGIPVVYSGSATALIPHLVLKPSQAGLETSLMVTTSKRTYMFKLKSSATGYVARVGFYYPGEMIQKFEDKKAALRERSGGEQTIATNPEIKMPLVDLSKVSYAYTIKGDDYSWKPTQVFDDGTSVYIQMPANIDSKSLPGLCVLVDGSNNDSQCEMVNFRFNQHFYIVDKLFNQAKLINGFDDSMQIITIQHKKEQDFWAWVWGR